MQEQSQISSSTTQMELREIPTDKVPKFLKEMEIGTIKTGYYVPLKRVASVRVSITNIHTYTDKRFETDQTEDKNGIILWRTV